MQIPQLSKEIFRKNRWRILFRFVFYSVCLLTLFKLHQLELNLQQPKLVLKNTQLLIPPPRSAIEENYYDVVINGEPTNKVTLFLKENKGDLWVSAKDLVDWKIIIPNITPVAYQSEKYYRLKQLPGLTYSINQENMSINIKVPAQLFEANKINGDASKIYHFTPPSPGLFINYSLLETRILNSIPHYNFNGLFNVGIFSKYGVGTTSFILQNTPDTRSPLRLLSTWRYDKPENMWTLSLGDSVSTGTNWSQSVNFGGVQWGTNFNTQPTFITFPQPGAKGQATVPSAVDLYVNGNLAQHQQVQPGLFAVTNIPVVTGAGTLQMVTTDIQGQQQVINIPFYASYQLLKKGLTDYTYEFGMIRQNLGITNFGYQRFLGAITKSVGLSDDFTVQGHGELLSNQETAGVSASKNLSNWCIINGSLAASHINGGRKNGGLAQVGLQRQTPTYSFNLSSQITTTNFTQAGLPPGQLSPRLVNQVSVGYNGGISSYGLNYLHQINRNQPSNNMLTASYNRNIFFKISMSITAMTNLSGTKNKGVFVVFTRALNDTTSTSINNSIQNGTHQEIAQIQRSLPPGPGYGYNLTAISGTNTPINKQGSFSYQNDIGTYVVQGINSQTTQQYSLNIAGSVVMLGGKPYLTRNLQNNSFGVVQIPGMNNIPVYTNGQLVSRTDKNGNALIPNLLPYQETKVKIDPDALPLNTTFDKTSTIVAPYYNSGIIIPFDVKVIHSATMTINQTSGQPIPEGAVATVAGQLDEFLIGSSGQAYFTGLSNENTIDVAWEEHHCQFSIKLPPTDEKNPLPDLGTITCNEVTNGQKKPTAPTTPSLLPAPASKPTNAQQPKVSVFNPLQLIPKLFSTDKKLS